MRVRVIEQTVSVLHRYREVLSLRKHGQFAFQILCHKVFRYLVPALLPLALVANWFAWKGDNIFKYIFIAQIAAYILAIAGWAGDRLGVRMGLLSIPYYFALGNFAIVIGYIKFLRGDAHVVWEPVRESRQQPVNSQNESLSEASL